MTDPPQRPSRRDDAVTERIEEAALRLFGERGYGATTLDDVAQEAGVSPRTVLRHFGTKEALILRPQQRDLDELLTALRAAAADGAPSPVEALRRAILVLAEQLGNRPSTAARAHAVAADPTALPIALAVRERWSSQLAETLAAVSPGLGAADAQLVASAGLTALNQAVVQWADAGAEADLRSLTDDRLGRLVALVRDAG